MVISTLFSPLANKTNSAEICLVSLGKGFEVSRFRGFKGLLSRESNKALRILSTSLASLCPIFKKLSNSDTSRYLNRKPHRIRLVKANGRESLEAIFQKAGMAKDLWPKFAIMNQMELGSTPNSGQMIKIVR